MSFDSTIEIDESLLTQASEKAHKIFVNNPEQYTYEEKYYLWFAVFYKIFVFYLKNDIIMRV